MLANSIIAGKLTSLCQQKNPNRETLTACCQELRQSLNFETVFLAYSATPEAALEILACEGKNELADACLYRLGVEDRMALARLPFKAYADITGKPVFNRSGSLRMQKPSSGFFMVYHRPKQDYLLLGCSHEVSITYDKEMQETLPQIWSSWNEQLCETVHKVLRPLKSEAAPVVKVLKEPGFSLGGGLESLGGDIGKPNPPSVGHSPILKASIPTTAGKSGEDRRRPVVLVDEVTRLYNKDYFEESLAIEVERAKRYSRTMSLVFLGVTPLQASLTKMEENVTATQVAEILAKSLRRVDVICRLETYKYGIILPDTADNTYGIIAKRVFKFFKQVMGDSPSVYLNISASTYPTHAGNHLLLMENAERLLAQAKEVGPNKAVLPE